jgi:GT2 family glycosyltransferase
VILREQRATVVLKLRYYLFLETTASIAMQLSIIIVNYNSKLLIEKCIVSVNKALHDIQGEIIVVDNNSTDGSAAFLQKLAAIKLVLNTENHGFAKACNQGFKISTGKYVLFLNPDTIVPETALSACIRFFETHPDAGAVGVRMLDGKGKFLKESKRSYPSPPASFYKLFGLADIFPRSKTFAKYYQGHLQETAISNVEVLSGAFMMVSAELFKKINGFDEDFFMYGEDIDLSLRINKAGYKNYYLGNIEVTHLKGGSTTYNSSYVRDFYGAMKLFVKKHYSNRPALYRSLLNAGISVRKIMALAGLIFR